MESTDARLTSMTQHLENVVRTLDPETGTRVLEAVDGTLGALRSDAISIGATPELAEMVQRIDAYREHLRRAVEEILARA